MAATDWLDCELSDIPLEVILRNLITVEAVTGCAGIRTVSGVDSGVSFIDCDLSSLTLEQFLRNVITVDSAGNPALRLLTAP